MTRSIKMILFTVTVLLLLSIPFLIPSGAVLNDRFAEMEEELWQDSGAWLVFVPFAHAESLPAEPDTESSGETVPADYSLPVDFSAGKKPNPAGYTDSGYQDDSITVVLDTRHIGDVVYRVAFVTIKDASQLRTGIAGTKVTSTKVDKPSKLAARYDAVIAISSDFYTNDTSKTTFEYRQGERIRAKRNNKKDALVIDQNGDFHLYAPLTDEAVKQIQSADYTIVNAFTFGPALIKDSQLLELNSSYGYNPNRPEPRMGIGQMGPLSYVLVLAEGRNGVSEGATHSELAAFMYDLGCIQAFNLDGGNTATLVFNGSFYQEGRSTSNERPQSDIIYFASAVDPSTWSE